MKKVANEDAHLKNLFRNVRRLPNATPFFYEPGFNGENFSLAKKTTTFTNLPDLLAKAFCWSWVSKHASVA